MHIQDHTYTRSRDLAKQWEWGSSTMNQFTICIPEISASQSTWDYMAGCSKERAFGSHLHYSP